MKSLKFNHESAQLILQGKLTNTWRLNDDKELSVNDKIIIVDKVNPQDQQTWHRIGIATINKVTELRLDAVDPNSVRDDYATQQAMYEALHKYYGTSIDPKAALKIVHFSFQPHEHDFNGLSKQSESFLKELKIYADGGSRGNPGPSASGFALLDMNDNIILKRGIYLGVTTNNQAEYRALKFALEEAQKQQAQTVHVYMDSLLVVNQILGKFKVNNLDLWPIYESIKELAHSFHQISFTHVPRALNTLADSMVNEALDRELLI